MLLCNLNQAQSPKSNIINGKEMFTKTSSTINAEVSYFTVCEDRKLSKACKNFFRSGNGEFSETSLTNTEINSITKSKTITGINGIQKTKIDKSTIYSLVRGTALIYFIGFGKNLNVVEYQSSTSSMAKKASVSPANKSCKSGCLKEFENCFLGCVPDCGDKCAKKWTECEGFCDKYVKKSEIIISAILSKPISQTVLK